MEIGLIIQIALFALLALALLVIVLGALKAIPKPRKGKAYRYSKNGDSWVTKYNSKEKSKAF